MEGDNCAFKTGNSFIFHTIDHAKFMVTFIAKIKRYPPYFET